MKALSSLLSLVPLLCKRRLLNQEASHGTCQQAKAESCSTTLCPTPVIALVGAEHLYASQTCDSQQHE